MKATEKEKEREALYGRDHSEVDAVIVTVSASSLVGNDLLSLRWRLHGMGWWNRMGWWNSPYKVWTMYS